MVLRILRGGGQDRIDWIERQLSGMLADDRHSFDIATAALVGGADPATVGPDLRETDHRVNQTERQIRRELVVHASVHGSIDIPAILTYMSVVKDVERIGDYAKNIFDLSAEGASFAGAADRDELARYRDRVSEMITQAADAFASRDADRAAALIHEGDALTDECDAKVAELVVSDRTAREAVPRALYFRHLKRIVAHLMNLLSAVTMPVDKIDYYDEDPEDRPSRD
ncbi:MAG: PhoU domain-containing protein [Nitriliruptorales bacterium]